MQEELQYPQVTLSQLELWLHNPTTQAYFQALRWMIDDSKELMGNGGCRADTAEETHVNTCVELELRATLELLLNPAEVLNHVNISGKSYGLLEIEEEPDNAEIEEERRTEDY